MNFRCLLLCRYIAQIRNKPAVINLLKNLLFIKENEGRFGRIKNEEITSYITQKPIINGRQDPLLDEAKEFILETKQTSISALQHHLRIGFMRATRMIEQLEKEGFVSKADKYLKREILGDK